MSQCAQTQTYGQTNRGKWHGNARMISSYCMLRMISSNCIKNQCQFTGQSIKLICSHHKQEAFGMIISHFRVISSHLFTGRVSTSSSLCVSHPEFFSTNKIIFRSCVKKNKKTNKQPSEFCVYRSLHYIAPVQTITILYYLNWHGGGKYGEPLG